MQAVNVTMRCRLRRVAVLSYAGRARGSSRLTDETNLTLPGEDGYRLWLRYACISDEMRRARARDRVRGLFVEGDSPTLRAAARELSEGLSGLLRAVVPVASPATGRVLCLGTPASSPRIAGLGLAERLARVGDEGFVLCDADIEGRKNVALAANTDVGVLYGAFHFLRWLGTARELGPLDVEDKPRVRLRVLDHWDNLDGSIERGYAGWSLWDWHKLPDYVAPRYRDYARANASVGINGVVLTNVNADARVITERYLLKVSALAGVFRPFGIRVYLTARFNAPVELSGLETADPLDARVRQWWREKVAEIYRYVPDFGGFLVKANSEGQPGPQNYGRTHADGGNLLAEALEPHGGVVMWRAFVYADENPDDRAKQASQEFVPLDGTFRRNLLLQVKNGPIDFQPREPFHPLFGAMPKTPLMIEFQLTQEYLGFATHLAYLGTLFEECLTSDTYARGAGSPVSSVVDGTLDGHALSGMAAVANVGNERNWCGHPFAQANWYAFGRLSWDHALGAKRVAEEWLALSFCEDARFLEPATTMMLESRQAVVDYMTPLGLHHLMARHHHYGPGPWVEDAGRADWNSTYYHRADAEGLGFDRTPRGSNAAALYHPPLSGQFAHVGATPEELLLWFHHVPWHHVTESGRSLWDELCLRYQRGVDAVRGMQRTWASLAPFVDAERFEHVRALLVIQEQEARWWRDACVLYFQTFSRRPVPPGCEPAEKALSEYIALHHDYVPGI
jgi:alpha-glucuronidase